MALHKFRIIIIIIIIVHVSELTDRESSYNHMTQINQRGEKGIPNVRYAVTIVILSWLSLWLSFNATATSTSWNVAQVLPSGRSIAKFSEKVAVRKLIDGEMVI